MQRLSSSNIRNQTNTAMSDRRGSGSIKLLFDTLIVARISNVVSDSNRSEVADVWQLFLQAAEPSNM